MTFMFLLKKLTPLALCLWLTSSLSVWGAQPADGIPDSASLVVRLKAPEQALEKLADYVDSVQSGAGDQVREGLSQIGLGMGNPGLEGVDTAQDVWVVVFAQPGDPPTVVFVMTAKDVDDVKDALPANFEVQTSGKILAYSEDSDSLTEVMDGLKGEGKSLLGALDAASRKTFDAADVSLAINIRQLVEDFSEELDQAEPQLNTIIDQITNALPDGQRSQLAPVFGMYRLMGASLIQGVRDTKSVVVGITYSDSLIRFEKRVQVGADTPTARFLTRQAPTELALMNRLPVGKHVYVGTKFDMEKMIEWSLSLTKGMLAESGKEDEFAALAKEMAQLKYGEMAMYFELGPESPALRGGSVVVVDAPLKLRELSRRFMTTVGTLKTEFFTQTTTMEPDALKVGGNAVDRVTVKQEFPEQNDPLGIQKKMQALLFGEDGIEQLVMYQPKAGRVLQTLGGVSVLEQLHESLEGTGGNPALAKARQAHPVKANLVGMMDLARAIVQGLVLAASEQDNLPFNVAAVEDLELEPTFVSFSLAFEPTAVRAQMDIPVEQVQNIAAVIRALTGQ